MKKARMIGSFIEYKIKENNLDVSFVADYIGITENQLKRFCKGRLFLSYSQLAKIAEMFSIAVSDVLQGNNQWYEDSFSDKFDSPENREIILDIIDSYMDIVEAINFVNKK